MADKKKARSLLGSGSAGKAVDMLKEREKRMKERMDAAMGIKPKKKK